MTTGTEFPVLAFLGLGIAELAVLGLVALLVFGGRLPEVMRNLGRSYAKFRHGMSELTNPIRDEMRRLDVTPPKPASGTRSTDLPPAAETPPASYEPSGEPDTEDKTEDKRTETGADDSPKPTTRTTGGAADEPPPV